MAKKSGDKWTFHLEAEQFVVQDDKGQKAMADGFELKGGFIELADKEIRLIKKQTEETASEPTDHEVSVIFVAPEAAANESKLTLQFRDFPKVKIDASTKRAAPALPPPPKTTEPAKKIEDKTPPKKEEVKKTDETPKKIEPAKKPDDAPKKVEIAKKIEETPKKIETPKPPEVKKADPRADVEVVEWIITDTLPGADPKTKAMPLSSSDRLDGNTFIAVKVKLSGKACAAMKGEVTWKVRLAAKDFSIEGDAPQPFAGRGLEREGNYGSTVVSGYFPWADLVLPFEEEPEFLVQGVFFTIPRTVVARGDLTLFFRDSPPVKLAEGKRKK
jgi:hypothetical protein